MILRKVWDRGQVRVGGWYKNESRGAISDKRAKHQGQVRGKGDEGSRGKGCTQVVLPVCSNLELMKENN